MSDELEVKVLRNLSKLVLGHNQIFVAFAVVHPIKKVLSSSKGRIDAYQRSIPHCFTRFYFPGDDISFRLTDELHGELSVGDVVYHCKSDGNAPVSYESMEFNNIYAFQAFVIKELKKSFVKSYLKIIS